MKKKSHHQKKKKKKETFKKGKQNEYLNSKTHK